MRSGASSSSSSLFIISEPSEHESLPFSLPVAESLPSSRAWRVRRLGHVAAGGIAQPRPRGRDLSEAHRSKVQRLSGLFFKRGSFEGCPTPLCAFTLRAVAQCSQECFEALLLQSESLLVLQGIRLRDEVQSGDFEAVGAFTIHHFTIFSWLQNPTKGGQSRGTQAGFSSAPLRSDRPASFAREAGGGGSASRGDFFRALSEAWRRRRRTMAHHGAPWRTTAHNGAQWRTMAYNGAQVQPSIWTTICKISIPTEHCSLPLQSAPFCQSLHKLGLCGGAPLHGGALRCALRTP